MDRISGKTIVITGAARGIGYATAKALLARGARGGDRRPRRDRSSSRRSRPFPNSGWSPGTRSTSPTRSRSAPFLDKARIDGDGHVDVLINNAGVMPIGGFLEQTDEAIRTSIEVNFSGVLTGCRLVLPEMVRRRSGHIVNIASLAGVIAVPGQVVYAGTKFAVVGLSTALADEFAPHGIEVTVVMPPFTNTELIAVPRHRCRQQARRTRGHRGGHREGARQAEDARVGARRSAVAAHDVIAMLGPRGRRWVKRRTGSDRVFLDFDSAARQSYEERAQHATGLAVEESAQWRGQMHEHANHGRRRKGIRDSVGLHRRGGTAPRARVICARTRRCRGWT